LALAALLLAAPGCGSDGATDASTPVIDDASGTSGPSGAAPVADTADEAEAPTIERAGCHEYCQQAGQYGDAPAGPQEAVTTTSDSVELLDDGAVPLELECHLPAPCEGAILLSEPNASGALGEFARADLALDAETTKTIGIPLSADSVAAVERTGPLELYVTLDSLQSVAALPEDEAMNWTGFGGGPITVTAP
jgi:hypothetical protein